MIVRQVQVAIDFYKNPAGPKGYDDGDKITSLTWTLDANVEPNGMAFLTGSIDGGHAQSRQFKSYEILSQVLPHTGKS